MSHHASPATSIKLVLLGEAAVGKSSLVLRFVSNDFQENKEPTIGAAFLTQKCTIGDRTIKYEIWDTAGQERFASLAPMYYRNAQAAIVVYDITKPASFIKARHWVKELHEQASKDIIIALVGNKYDLVEDEAEEDNGGESLRKVSIEEGQALAEEEGLLFYETSAKTSYNVNDVFVGIGSKIPDSSMMKQQNAQEVTNEGRIDLTNNGAAGARRTSCCTIFPGTIFPGTIFPGTIFPGTIFPGTIFPGTIFPGTILPVLRVGYIPEHFSFPLLTAQEQGFFTQYGLKIELVKVPEGSGRLIDLLKGDDIDVAIGLTEAFVADIGKGNDKIKIVDNYVVSPLLWAVSTGIDRKDIKDLSDLSKIGISRFGSGSYIMSFVLANKLGLDKFKDFAVCNNFATLRKSVNGEKEGENGGVVESSDAFMWEYFTTKKYYDCKEIKQIGQIYTPWPSWVISASSKSLETKQQSIHDFIKALSQGIVYYNNHIEEAVQFIAANLDYSQEDAREWTKTVEFNEKLGQKPLDWDKIVVNTTKVLKNAGVLKDSDELVNSRMESNVYKNNI
ncbi:hypothetical protein KGF56_004916 [Candida oxycetoniae]|uniref:Ca3427-like PBP 2 domain-containing protein n=1 Tax=Candida oxycetoniae TaxID=497107 RepID=A0AAI9WVU8_9ASCO|nr:uncharacterized protein KGF56_004916 [Candida oxycetoniae]KAI3402346.2 hypothetical protein KGF56_004916 [Candida oxycetoniae]